MRPPNTPAIAFVVLTAVLAACAGDADRGGDAPVGEVGGTVVIATPGNFAPSPPPVVFDAQSRAVADLVFDRLADIGPQMNTLGDQGFTPRLARQWEWSADSLSIAFAIDPDARWHDGQPVKATDVRFTFDLLKDPLTASSVTPLIAGVDSMTVRDSLTAVAWFGRRTPEQFYNAVYHMHVLPEHVYRDIPRNQLNRANVSTVFVGSGPFRLANFEPSVRLELIADTANYRGRPNLDRVIWGMTTDAGANIAQFMSGQADIMENLPTDLLPRVDSNPNVKAVPYTGLGYAYMEMNLRHPRRNDAPHPIFSDRAVRRAISMALDRQAMHRNVFGDMGTLGAGPYPRALADTAVRLLPFDRAAAAALLDSAGWRVGTAGVRQKEGRPLAFGLVLPTSSRQRMQYAVLIQEQLKGMGIRVDIDAVDIQSFLSRWEGETYDALISAWSPDPSRSGIKQNWTAEGMMPGGVNHISYANPAVDAAIDSALAELDPERARSQMRRAYQMIVDDAPAVWLYDMVTILGLHERLRPEALRPDGWWMGLPRWWISQDERIERDRIGLRAAPAQP